MKTRFSSLLLGGNTLISIFEHARNQSSQGTKASIKGADAAQVFCKQSLKILNAKTIKFWYNEGQKCWHISIKWVLFA